MAISVNGAGIYTNARLDSADTATGWTAETLEGAGGGASLLNSVGTIDLVREGVDARASRVNKQRVAIRYNYTPGVDYTTGSTGAGTLKFPDGNLYVWGAFLAAGAALLKANGGIQIYASDGTNISYWNVDGSDTYSGGFIKWATNMAITPSETSGTAADIGNITNVGLVCDVGGATTRFDNMVVDAIDTGTGFTFQGTTVGDALFVESADQDEVTATGLLQNSNGIIFSQGSIEFSGTAQTSSGETLIFRDTLGGAVTYGLDITGSVTLINSGIGAAGAVNFNLDASTATAFNATGGSITKCNQLTLASTTTLDGTVLSNITLSDLTNATLTGCTFNLSGLISQNGATLTGNTFNSGTASASLLADNLALVTKNTFVSDGSNHAVELPVGTIAGTPSIAWDNVATGYAGVDGSTGNETINVLDTTGTLTINVAATASSPSIRTAGATVNVVAGQVTLTLTDLVVNTEVRVYVAGTTTELDGVENSGTTFAYTYTFSPSTFIDIVVHNISYQYLKLSNVELGAANASLPIQQRFDRNYSNPDPV